MRDFTPGGGAAAAAATHVPLVYPQMNARVVAATRTVLKMPGFLGDQTTCIVDLLAYLLSLY